MKKPLIIMISIVGGLALLVGLGLGGYFYFTKKPSNKPLTATQLSALRVDLPQMTTNLKDGLIQFTVSVEAKDKSTKQEVTDLLPQVQDAVNQTMHQYSSAQLSQPGGLANLKASIQAAVNHLLPTGQITAVYFSTYVVQ